MRVYESVCIQQHIRSIGDLKRLIDFLKESKRQRMLVVRKRAPNVFTGTHTHTHDRIHPLNKYYGYSVENANSLRYSTR